MRIYIKITNEIDVIPNFQKILVDDRIIGINIKVLFIFVCWRKVER
jgi:hypothetical protein